MAAWAVAATATLIPASELRLVGADGVDTLLGVCNVAAAPRLRCWALAPATNVATEFALVFLTAGPLAVVTAGKPGAVAHALTGGLVQI